MFELRIASTTCCAETLCAVKSVGIDRDVKLARLTACNADDRDAGQARELWSHDVSCDVAQRRLVTFV